MRNALRGDGYFTIDLSLSKGFELPFAEHRLRFRWDVFNMTNTPMFDVNGSAMTPDRTTTFGQSTRRRWRPATRRPAGACSLR